MGIAVLTDDEALGGTPLPSVSYLNLTGKPLRSERKPTTETVVFDDPNNPSEMDLVKVGSYPVSEHFEVKSGKIVPRFKPIRDLIKPPQGRTDYGWGEEMKIKHLKSAYGRGWPQFPFNPRPHDGVMHIVGGGPSLRKCIPELRRAARQKKNFILSVNKTHDFLWNLPKLGLGPPIPSWGAALLDPCDWVKDYITPRPGVQYLIGDQCAPATFDVFEKPGITRYVWRATHPNKDHGIPPKNSLFIVGGSTVGLRCRTLAYFMGFRQIHYWGFDSSADENNKLHGYEKVESAPDRLTVKAIDEHGFEREFVTNSHMARQAQEWLELRQEWFENTKRGRVQFIHEVFHGDGLLPTLAARLGQHADPKRNMKIEMQEHMIPDPFAIPQDGQKETYHAG